MKNFLLSPFLCVFFAASLAQSKSFSDRRPADLSENNWVDSVFNTLSSEQKIAQLIVIRTHSNLGPDHVAQVTELIKKYNVGALCFFQGGPVRQANLTNYYQTISKTPLLITIDAEYGLGMRLDSVAKFPYQLTLGALDDPSLIYEMGRAVGQQCKRIGVQVNYAPVVDINNDPDNPVIGFRSFGEDKDKVIRFGLAYMKGIQDVGIMACAKHFPGHGDVHVDSHLDLPVINKSIEQLDSLELKPFRALFDAGVGGVMIAHLYIPSIDSTANMATSLSKKNVTELLRRDLGYNGLTFTDALEMKGVSKFWPAGEVAVQALIAGNDMLCLPESVPDAIAAIEKAVNEKRISWDDINEKLKKVLHAKYRLGLYQWKPVDTTNLLSDLNARTDEIRYRVARQTITIVRNKVPYYIASPKIACVSIGTSSPGPFASTLHQRRNAYVFNFSYKDAANRSDSILRAIRAGNFDEVVISISGYNLRPANNYGISKTAIDLFEQLQNKFLESVLLHVLMLNHFVE